MESENEPRASKVYEIVRTSPSMLRRAARIFTVFVANLLSMGSGPANPGGDLVRVVEKATGREALSAMEEMGDDGHGTVSSIRSDLSSMTAEAFATKWL